VQMNQRAQVTTVVVILGTVHKGRPQ